MILKYSLIIFTMLFALGCHPSKDEVRFRTQVEDWVSVGMPVDDAAKSMRSHRFRVTEETFQDRENLTCKHYQSILPVLTSREWRVILWLENDCVQEIETYIFVHAP